MQQTQMFPMIRAELTELLNGYIERPVLLDGMESYIVAPQLGNRSGVLGSTKATVAPQRFPASTAQSAMARRSALSLALRSSRLTFFQ